MLISLGNVEGLVPQVPVGVPRRRIDLSLHGVVHGEQTQNLCLFDSVAVNGSNSGTSSIL